MRVRVAMTDEFPEGSMRAVRVGEDEIAVYHVQGRFYATAARCLHQGGPLANGKLDGTVVTCPWHRWSYDVTTGTLTFPPNVRLRTYESGAEHGEVWVEMP